MTPPPDAGARRYLIVALCLVALIQGVRLLTLTHWELSPDEAYYWVWSRHLALSYYDQGPLIAVVIRITTSLFGSNTFGVRLGVWACTTGVLLAAIQLARRFFSDRAGLIAAVLLLFTPLTTVGSVIATYDELAALAWAAVILALERAIYGPERQQRWWWLSVGVWVGLGMLAKYTMILVAPCVLLFLVLSPEHRVWLKRWEPWAALAISFAMFSGVLVWNAGHHWWTFSHVLYLANKSRMTASDRFAEFTGSQAGLLGPVLFVGALWACVAKTRLDRSRQVFLVSLGLPVFLFFCLLALKSKVQANWAVTAWISLVVLWAGNLDDGLTEAGKRRRAARNLIGASVITGSVLCALILWPSSRRLIHLRLKAKTDVTNTTHGWRSLAHEVAILRSVTESKTGRPVFVASNGYEYCSEMAFYLPDHPQTWDLFLHNRLDTYATSIDQLRAHLGESAIFVSDSQQSDKDLRAIFGSVEWQPPMPVYRPGVYRGAIKTNYIALCGNFNRYEGLNWASRG
ncbi:MAG: glycosyltransferase family 39 protein [Armatimonadetes bacterium]|nr:glycosyltransferase family 39 protein [Armatimonadota bacterium]MDE2207494.1 glycosyltransferase family 39 protein [Armatimonadota bacterium]